MKVIVLMGGPSAEREVSLRSGLAVLDGLRRLGLVAEPYDPLDGWVDTESETEIRTGSIPTSYVETNEDAGSKVDLGRFAYDLLAVDDPIIFNVLHGQWGEDGAVQAILETLGIRYSGSGITGSALAMDKLLSKRILRDAGVPVAAALTSADEIESIEASIGFPCIVKPVREGSSVGLSIVRERGGLVKAIQAADRPGAPALIEAYIPGREFSVGVLGGKALEPGEVIPKGSEIFDFSRKYQAGGAAEIFPAEIRKETRDQIQRLAESAQRALGLRDYSRIDFRMNPQGDLFCLEANTLPGMTPLSLLPRSAKAAGIDFDDLLMEMLRGALDRRSFR